MRTLIGWTDTAGNPGALEIDATPSQGFESIAEVTEHPVETGAAITDHVRPVNGIYTLEGVISNTPIELPATQMNGVTRTPATLRLSSGEILTTYQWSGPFDRVRTCDAVLKGLVDSGTVVTLSTGLRDVENLIITRYKVDRTSETGLTLPITLELKALRIVSTRRVPVPAVRRAQVQLQRGAQPTDNRSFLARAWDGGAPASAARSGVLARLAAVGGGS